MSNGHSSLRLSDQDFRQLSDLVRRDYGINLTEAKKVMVETRLRRRLPRTGCRSLSEYTKYLFSEEGLREELVHMVDAVSTNKTDFFREPRHFDFLTEQALPDWWNRRSGSEDTFRVWSAASSTGEEPYTIAMTLAEFGLRHRGFAFSVFASDISSRVLDRAERAVYDESQIEPVPGKLRNRYLRRGTGDYTGRVRVAPALRNRVRFDRVNLMEPVTVPRDHFDAVFLRNVIIYFERDTKRRVVTSVLDRLRPGGFLFVGHSETLFDMSLPLDMVGPNTYRKKSTGRTP